MQREAKEKPSSQGWQGIVRTYWRAVAGFLACLGIFAVIRYAMIYFSSK